MRISPSDLKDLLVKTGTISDTILKNAETIAEQTHDSLDQVLVKRHVISERDLTKLYAESIEVEFVDLTNIAIPPEVLLKIPERVARKYQAILFGQDKGFYKLAMADPEDLEAIDFLEKQLGGQVKIYISTASDINTALDLYRNGIEGEINQAIKESSGATPSEEVSAEDIADDAPITKTVNVILEYGIKSRASDIHIEPRESFVQVRYRIDGLLSEAMTLPRQIQNAVVSRIKIMANLKIDEHRLPQDGRFKLSVGSKTVAIRVSTLPVMDGEKIVMRILDESIRAATLDELGFSGDALRILVDNLQKPHGMTLITGPTGSGKSTTLYAILSMLNTPGVNISTVEDPVEYRINGVNQTQVNPKTGMSFASGLRALLRQDPNVIMVGEVRDIETANLAVQAALTGHIVLSTLHTNDASTTLPRLLDMKIEPFLIASTVNSVVGQRLVRKLCPDCRQTYKPSSELLAEIKKTFAVDAFADEYRKQLVALKDEQKKRIEPKKEESKGLFSKITSDTNIVKLESHPYDTTKDSEPVMFDPENFTLYLAKGCPNCSQTGYVGRICIAEVLEMSEQIAKLITSKATSEDIRREAINSKMLTMQQDGFIKALRGMTTIEEVLRVTRD